MSSQVKSGQVKSSHVMSSQGQGKASHVKSKARQGKSSCAADLGREPQAQPVALVRIRRVQFDGAELWAPARELGGQAKPSQVKSSQVKPSQLMSSSAHCKGGHQSRGRARVEGGTRVEGDAQRARCGLTSANMRRAGLSSGSTAAYDPVRYDAIRSDQIRSDQDKLGQRQHCTWSSSNHDRHGPHSDRSEGKLCSAGPGLGGVWLVQVRALVRVRCVAVGR